MMGFYCLKQPVEHETFWAAVPVVCCWLSPKAVKMSSKNTIEDKNVTEQPSRGKSYTGIENPSILGFVGADI